MEEGHREQFYRNIQSTFGLIYGYLLTFSIWRLSLNFIPVYYRLVLYWSQRGYFSFEVQSCTFLFSSISRINRITPHTWLFWVPSSKQVVDREESKTILLSPENQPNSVVVWRILLHQQKIFPSGRNGSVRVDALRQSRQRHPGGGLLRARPQYHTSRCISPSNCCFTVSSCSVGLLF